MEYPPHLCHLLLQLLLLGLTCASTEPDCPTALSTCHCGLQSYSHPTLPSSSNTGRPSFVTNCTGTNFTDSSILNSVPEQTEVLIFRNNNFTELAANILHQNKRYDKLFLVDLSDNHIQHVHGKTFHNMKSVQILILNNNRLLLSGDNLHARLFSTLHSLEELHLDNAFEQDQPTLLDSLGQIFVQSQLANLKVLNLERNHLAQLNRSQLFCPLTELQQLSLARNSLTDFRLNISCLTLLHKLDLSHNRIVSLDQSSIDRLCSGPAHYSLDLGGNPFDCNCTLLPFFQFVRNNTAGSEHQRQPHLVASDQYRCYSSGRMEIAGKYFDDLNEADFECSSVNNGTTVLIRYRYYITLSYLVLIFLLSLLLFLLSVLLYTNRRFLLNTWSFFILEIGTKRDYTALDKETPTCSRFVRRTHTGHVRMAEVQV